eukprot:TRINITY_DN31558_c0_g1_i1.p1 TRINITY_DN31558_c0_g1~~TRINITY_DN31558_c0_g1_i1.p1  ORF type:complete len:526 (+),score=33.04 TRINITY_DN31558_c0_g1_i1:50-1579(+)
MVCGATRVVFSSVVSALFARHVAIENLEPDEGDVIASLQIPQRSNAGRQSQKSYGISFAWYPNTAYDETSMAEFDADVWWRCGTGATPAYDSVQNSWFCNAFDPPASVSDLLLSPGGEGHCHTLGPLAVRAHGPHAIFFWAESSTKELVSAVAHEDTIYTPVLSLFSGPYCTGVAHEFFAETDTKRVPKDARGSPPGVIGFTSFRVSLKPFDSSPPLEEGLGIKTVIFPDVDMTPYDETSCVKHAATNSDGRLVYTPFKAEGWNASLDCVSAVARVACMESDTTVPYAAVAGQDGGGYGCVDFAGCNVCTVPGSAAICGKNPECSLKNDGQLTPLEYCEGSPVSALGSGVTGGYPLGSFFHGLYLTTKSNAAICADSVASDASSTAPEVCTQGTSMYDKYLNYCVVTRFHNCNGGVDAQLCGGNACPDPNALPYYWVSSKISELCDPSFGRGACFNTIGSTGQPNNPVNCGLMQYRSEEGEVQDSTEWPVKITCWTTKIVPCHQLFGHW